MIACLLALNYPNPSLCFVRHDTPLHPQKIFWCCPQPSKSQEPPLPYLIKTEWSLCLISAPKFIIAIDNCASDVAILSVFFWQINVIMTCYDTLFNLQTGSVWECGTSNLINVESSEICILCESSKRHNAPIEIDSDSPQSPAKKKT